MRSRSSAPSSHLPCNPRALALGKRAFYAQRALDQAAAYDLAGATMTVNLGMDDAHEGGLMWDFGKTLVKQAVAHR